MSFRQIYHIVQDLLNNYDQLILVMGDGWYTGGPCKCHKSLHVINPIYSGIVTGLHLTLKNTEIGPCLGAISNCFS